MSGDDLVLAVLQPNTLVSGDRNMRLIEPTDGSKLRVPDDDVRASPSAALTNATGGQRSWQVPFESNRARRSPETDGWDGCLADNAAMKASAGCIAGRTRGSRALSVAAGRLPRRDGGQRRPDGACRIPPRHGPGRRRRPTLVLGVARERARPGWKLLKSGNGGGWLPWPSLSLSRSGYRGRWITAFCPYHQQTLSRSSMHSIVLTQTDTSGQPSGRSVQSRRVASAASQPL